MAKSKVKTLHHNKSLYLTIIRNHHFMNKKNISLVLGSGGARGMAHIGVIRYLLDNNFKIESIVGCSVGALVGGIYAAGKIDDFEDWMTSLKRSDIIQLMDVSWKLTGFIKGDKVINELESIIGSINIEELDIPFTAVATDIHTEKEVWLNTGNLFQAIRASASLPLFLTPVTIDDKLLIDGGVLNPVPIAPAYKYGADIIVAVNLGGSPTNVSDNEMLKKKVQPQKDNGIFGKITSFVNNLLERDSDKKEEYGMYDIADKAFDTMQNAIAQQKLAAYTPDLVIEIPRNACGTLEFDRSREMIELGYEKARVELSKKSM